MSEDEVPLVDRLKPPIMSTVGSSERSIKDNAKAAMAYLQRFGMTDLHKVLGLTPYLESENNAD